MKMGMEKIISTSDTKPRFAVIQIGEDENVDNEIADFKMAYEDNGIVFSWYFFPEDITIKDLIFELEELAPFEDGLMVVSAAAALKKIDDEEFRSAMVRIEEHYVGAQRPQRREAANDKGL